MQPAGDDEFPRTPEHLATMSRHLGRPVRITYAVMTEDDGSRCYSAEFSPRGQVRVQTTYLP